MRNPVAFSQSGLEIAIIGMAGRFPGAKNIEEFWQNLQDGIESIASFTNEELISSGIDSAVLNNPHYVRSRGVLEDIELFDASFFGFNPREAEIIDPQHRLLLECAWEALENAGYDSKMYKGLIGVYAGTSINRYGYLVYSNQNLRNSIDSYQLFLANDKDFLTTRISYKLDLEGPSINVQTACSTSLVAVHLACQGLLGGECDIALAGGVAISSLKKAGYFYQEEGLLSPDGHCRAFDANAQGTVSGEGVGIVVLKRLEDAVNNGDCIHAVIKGSAINNDGALKVSYTAPRIDSQAKVIKAAQIIAEVDPNTITYIEAHGTGTSLGDPIEIAALKQAFSDSTQKKGFCAIGSVKTNIGHLDTTAGVAGLIKTVLALKNKQIPPSLHFKQPNPQIDFYNSPFYVNTTLSPWEPNDIPRRAGVSSFGIGGTNAHVILEEAPPIEPSTPSRPKQLLLLSAKTSSALEIATANLAAYLKQHPDLNLADLAYTLHVGRRAFDHRRMLVCQDLDDAQKALESLNQERVLTYSQEPCNRPIAFMFPGQGVQYVNMGQELYQTEPTFREQVDYCCLMLKPHLGIDLRHILYPSEEQIEAATARLKQTDVAQPALFVIEYALAQLWMSWGIYPEVTIGHSIGEYVAACLAGVFSLKDALALIAARGKLMQQLPTGAMLSVSLSEDEVQLWLGKEISLAASNAPHLCVVSGSEEAIADLQSSLIQQGVECCRLHTSHAFHSSIMDSILKLFTELVSKVSLNAPKIPFVSNVSGTWITTAEATDPNYWAKQLRHTVRFAAGITELAKQPRILLEVGSGRTLSTFAKQYQAHKLMVLTSLRHPKDKQSDVTFLLNTLGQLWLAGVQVDWSGFYAQERRHRIPLPTYPFERQRYWINPQEIDDSSHHHIKLSKKPNIVNWFYLPVWKQAKLLEPFKREKLIKQKLCWLIFVEPCGVGSQIAKRLEQEGQDVITVTVGEEFTPLSDHAYIINPQQRDNYDTLLQALQTLHKTPQIIVHLWNITPKSQVQSEIEFFEKYQNLGFYSLLFLAQALGKQNFTHYMQITVITNNIHNVVGQEDLKPEKATVLGPCKVIPQEYPNITCRNVDIVISESTTSQENKFIDQLIRELTTQPSDIVIAYRGGHRWVQTFEPAQLSNVVKGTTRLREGGIYLITGDFVGSLGLVFAEALAKTANTKLILIGNLGLPERNEWFQWLATHDEQDRVSHQIKKIQTIEKLGAELLIIKADVADEEQMQAAINRVYKHFGQIHGVFHVTSMSDEKSAFSIQEISQTECERQFHSKVYGLSVLEKVLQGKELDFYLVQSSLSSVVGGLGLVAYSAANLFMDAFVNKRNQTSSVPWFSINWDVCREENEKQEQEAVLGKSVAELAMTPKEVWDVCQQVFSIDSVGQFVVSPGDLQARIDKWIKREASQIKEHLKHSQQGYLSSHHSRPNLQTVYVASRNEVERTIANLWQELLGVEKVGIYDNFFELGGHSLLAVQVTSRLREIFQVDLPLRSILFDAPTVAGLASVITEQQPKKAEELQEIAALLQEVKTLSPEEIQEELFKAPS